MVSLSCADFDSDSLSCASSVFKRFAKGMLLAKRLNTLDVTRPFLSMQRVWLAKLEKLANEGH